MKKLLLLTMLFGAVSGGTVMAQEAAAQRPTTLADYKVKPYNEEIDGMKQIDEAIAKAKAEGKKVICQVGGNWCIWCLRFADFITKDEEIDNLVNQNFVYIHVNNSPKNRNTAAMERLGNQQLGYPHLVLLNADGEIEDVKETGNLEENKSYNKQKVIELFANWTNKE